MCVTLSSVAAFGGGSATELAARMNLAPSGYVPLHGMKLVASSASWAWREVGSGFYTFRDTEALADSHAARPSLNFLAHLEQLCGLFDHTKVSRYGRRVSEQEGFKYDFSGMLLRAALADAPAVLPSETLVRIEVTRCAVSTFRHLWPWRNARAATSHEAFYISSMATFGGASTIRAATRR